MTTDDASMYPPSADGRPPTKVRFDFAARRWSAATYQHPDTDDVYDVEAFTKTNWNVRGAYGHREHIGTVRRIDDDTWRADSDTLGPIPCPYQDGYDFPTHGNALANLFIRTKPRLPRTMGPRGGLPLLYPMPGACRWCRCRVCTPKDGRRLPVP